MKPGTRVPEVRPVAILKIILHNSQNSLNCAFVEFEGKNFDLAENYGACVPHAHFNRNGISHLMITARGYLQYYFLSSSLFEITLLSLLFFINHFTMILKTSQPIFVVLF